MNWKTREGFKINLWIIFTSLQTFADRFKFPHFVTTPATPNSISQRHHNTQTNKERLVRILNGQQFEQQH